MGRKRIRIFMPLMLVVLTSMILSSCILVLEPTPVPETVVPTETVVSMTATLAPSSTAVTNTVIPSATYTLTKTATPTQTYTATPSRTATATNTATATWTATPTRTPTATRTPSATSMPYRLQQGSPAYISNYAHPQAGCSWIGVAGQVFGPQGLPQTNLVVVVEGVYGGKVIDAVGVTGTVAGDTYGPGGYEVPFSDKLLATQGMLSAQVFDLNGNPLAEAVTFDTYSSCAKNLIIINFSQ